MLGGSNDRGPGGRLSAVTAHYSDNSGLSSGTGIEVPITSLPIRQGGRRLDLALHIVVRAGAVVGLMYVVRVYERG